GIACVALWGCGDDTGGGQGGSTSSSTATTSTDTVSSTDASSGSTQASTSSGGVDCPLPTGTAAPAGPRAFSQVQGRVEGPGGEGLAGQPVQVCGRDICLFGDTDGSGNVTVNHSSDPIDIPLFKAG